MQKCNFMVLWDLLWKSWCVLLTEMRDHDHSENAMSMWGLSPQVVGLHMMQLVQCPYAWHFHFAENNPELERGTTSSL